MDKEETNTKGTTVAYLYENKNGLAPAAGGKPVAAPTKGGGTKRAAAPPPPPPPAPAKVKVEPPPPITVEVIHGSSRAQSKFAQEHKSAPEGQQE